MQKGQKQLKTFALLVVVMALLAGCDRNASPEGRMGLKLESLQQQMLDSMQHHNRVLLDSIGQLRRELTAIKEAQK